MILAIEGGATHARLGLYTEEGELLREAEGGSANPVALGVERVVANLVAAALPLRDAVNEPLTLYVGLAGALNTDIRQGIAEGLARTLGADTVQVTTDLHPVLFANTGQGDGVLVVAGTGSAVLARNRRGRVIRVGGRGALFGDEGSAYRLAVEGMRAACAAVDGLGLETPLVQSLPAALGLSTLDDLAVWAGSAAKKDIAALAQVVTESAAAGDVVAQACIEEQARRLAAQAVAAMEQLFLEPGARIFLQGTLLTACSAYRRAFSAAVDQYVEAQIMDCRYQGHAAVRQALHDFPEASWLYTWRRAEADLPQESLSPTESAAEGVTLDRCDALEIVRMMNQRDRMLPDIVAREEEKIARIITLSARSMMGGGRIIYAGAGTSGRLGVLDASECPPTFGVSPDRVVGLIAGGDKALRESIEGEEDSREAAVADLLQLNPTTEDVMIGIAASGSTPYVAAFLDKARELGCPTALVCCHPHPPIEADIKICLNTGPEVLTGSTRLKAGTATKMVLNMISTGAMALSGYVYNGLMVEMRPSNAKLRRRAARIVDQVTHCGEARATDLLTRAQWLIPVAITMQVKGLEDPEAARETLERLGGRVRDLFPASSLE